MISVIQEAVVQGVSTRKIETVLAEFGIAGVSAGQVSQLCTAWIIRAAIPGAALGR